MDNTGGCQLYLSNDSLKSSITTAKSSEINVLVRGNDPDGDWVHLYLEHTLLCISVFNQIFPIS